jgi:hypothetical protein
MIRRRSLPGFMALVLSLAGVAVVAAPSAVLAGGGSVPGGNCEIQSGNSSEPYCSQFQADVGKPGIHTDFYFICPQQTNNNDIIGGQAYVWVWENNQSVAATATSHSSNGPGSTIWHNQVTVPTLPGYPAVLVGEGWCSYTCTSCVNPYTYTKVTNQNYFWVEAPTPHYSLNFDVLFSLGWEAMFGSSRTYGDQAFANPALLAALGSSGPPVITTTQPPSPNPKPNPPSPSPSPSTTSTTRPRPTTTTTTGRRSGG